MTLAETIYQKSLELPEDKAIEVLDFIDFLTSRVRSFVSKEQAAPIQDNDFAAFSGILKDSPNFNGDPLEIQHRMRDEWR
jgi:hypothetical protein